MVAFGVADEVDGVGGHCEVREGGKLMDVESWLRRWDGWIGTYVLVLMGLWSSGEGYLEEPCLGFGCGV